MATANPGMKNSFGLAIGVGRRPPDSEAMSVTADDAVSVGTALSRYCNMPRDNISILKNGNADKDGILGALKALVDRTAADPADLVVIYFSGHGYTIDDHYYLVSNDTDNDRITEKAIEGGMFVKELNAIKASKMLVFLDCCHSGGVTRASIPFDKESFLSNNNRVVLTACHESQVSYLSSPVSLFTYALVEGLAGKSLLTGDHVVNVFGLAMYVRERVAALSAQVLPASAPQKPQLNVLEESLTANFAIARFPNGEPKKLFFEKEFGLYSYENKSIDLSVPNTEDTEFRNQFDWISKKNSIEGNINTGYIVQGVDGNVTIHAGMSAEEVVKIFEKGQESVQKALGLMAILMQDKSAQAKELLGAVKAAQPLLEKTANAGGDNRSDLVKKIEGYLEEPVEKNIKAAIKELRGAREYPDISKSATILYADFLQYESDQEKGLDTRYKFQGMMNRLLTIFDKLKEFNHHE
jgi:Caspase domain